MLCAALLALTLTADPKPRLDQDGESLPKEAVQRLGSVRFLVNRFAGAAFSPDGKTVYTVSENDSHNWRQPYTSPGLVAWEVPTGKKLWQAGVDCRLEQVMADPDGKSVWVLERVKGETEFDPRNFQRVRYSAADGKELARTPLIESSTTLTLHSTGLMADAASDDDSPGPTLRVLDREGNATDFPPFRPAQKEWATAIVWSAKGDRAYLITHGSEFKSCSLAAFDVAKKVQLWSITTDNIGGWCVPPDGKSVVIVTQKGKDEKAVVHARRLDAKTGKELGAVEVPNVYCMDELTGPLMMGVLHFHPDGKTFFLIDKEERTVAIDVATWKSVDTKVKLTTHAAFSPDGKMILAPSGRHVVIRETDTGKRLSPNEPGGSQPDHITRLNFSPKSDRVIRSGGYKEPELEWDVTSGKETRRIEWKDDPTPQGKYGEALSADGQKKAVLEHEKDEWRVTVTDVNKPNEPPAVLQTGWKERGCPNLTMNFTPDNRYLVGAAPQFGLHIWDTATGKKSAEVNSQSAEYDGLSSDGMQISPNGRWVAVMERGSPIAQIVPPREKWKWQTGVFEIPSGKLVDRFQGNGDLTSLRWVNDRLAGVIDLSRYPQPFIGGEQPTVRKFSLLSLDPAVKTMREHSIGVDVRCWAAAPFGDTVAVGSSDGLRLYEASTGKLRHTFREQKRPVEVLAFSPDGRYLAAESVDGPLLVWDVRGDLTKPTKPDAAGWDRAWESLGSGETEKAFAAVRLFALHPDDGVAELKRRFAESQPSAEVIATAVAKLDDREFAVRLQAEQQLRAMGTAAFPALNKAMGREPSEEFKERAGRLLVVEIPADLRRAERAVEALRLADTESARKQIAEWAKGPEKDPLTVAAKRK